jgi:hypothetical protein
MKAAQQRMRAYLINMDEVFGTHSGVSFGKGANTASACGADATRRAADLS